MKRALFLSFAAVVASAHLAHAQVSYSVFIHDSTGRAISGAELSIPALGARAVTDSTGRGRFIGLTRGAYSVRARKLGYEPAAVRAHVDTDTPELEIVLRPLVLALDTVRVNATNKCPWKEFSGFACRRKSGEGLFLDDVAIDSANVEYAGMLFWDRPGYQVLRQDRTGIPYVISTTGWRCLVEIVNGLPLGVSNRKPIFSDQIIAIEAYVEPKQVPKIYEQYSWKGKYRCGLINYWTSSR